MPISHSGLLLGATL